MLGKPVIAQMRAVGEQFDEYLRRYQRYKPELKFEAGTPEVSAPLDCTALPLCASAERVPARIARRSQFVRSIVQSAEQDRLARAAEFERQAAAAAAARSAGEL